jgi:hypothetical protein
MVLVDDGVGLEEEVSVTKTGEFVVVGLGEGWEIKLNNITKKIPNARKNKAITGMRYEERFDEPSAIILVYSSEVRNSDKKISA